MTIETNKQQPSNNDADVPERSQCFLNLSECQTLSIETPQLYGRFDAL